MINETIKVRHIMSPDVFALRLGATAKEIAQALSDRGIGGAPVLNAEGHVVGIVSKSDLMGVIAKSDGGWRVAREVMTPAVIAVRAEDPAWKAVQLMVTDGVHRLIVLDETGHLAGIVTPMDVVKAVAYGKDLGSRREAVS